MKASHVHVLSCLLAEIERRAAWGEGSRPIEILDIGCGYGGLIADALEVCRDARIPVELYGFEVQEHGAGRERYLEETLGELSRRHPGIEWGERIRVVSSNEAWPFENGRFDFTISNQVVEHVDNLDNFFRQQDRVLARGGVAIHHFPSFETIVDPHSGVPFVHWASSDAGRAACLKFFSRLGLGKYRRYRRQRGYGLGEFVDEFVDYLRRYTSFRPIDRVRGIALENGVNLSARYNYALARRSIAGVTDCQPYTSNGEDLGFARLLSRFASITLVSGS